MAEVFVLGANAAGSTPRGRYRIRDQCSGREASIKWPQPSRLTDLTKVAPAIFSRSWFPSGSYNSPYPYTANEWEMGKMRLAIRPIPEVKLVCKCCNLERCIQAPARTA